MFAVTAVAVGLALGTGAAMPAWPAAATAQREPKLSLTVKASPVMSFAPSKIRFVGELKGGRNDNEELYCPEVEWDWNDGTTSESSADCEPYERGKSQIPRRFTIEHEYKVPGEYRVVLRLKKKSRTIISASAHVEVNGVSLPQHGNFRPLLLS